MATLLGIDIGTSSAKAVLFDSDRHTLIATAGQEYPIHRPAVDKAEQNPHDWWNAVAASVQQVTAGHKDIAAIGLCGQMHGGPLLNTRGEVVHPAVIWPDGRSSQQVQQLLDAVGPENYPTITGTLPAVGFMAPTLMWMQQHTPDVLTLAHKLLFPKDYIHYRLTDAMTTDPSDAAASGLFDIRAGDWSQQVIDAVNINAALLPDVRPSHAVTPLTPTAADALGLQAGIPVAAGCADQPAQALCNGIVAPGTMSITVGSGGQVFNPLTDVKTDPRIHVFNHAIPGTYYALGAILSAGLSLRWLRDLLGVDDYADLSAAAASVPAGADGLTFLPYLTGERTPHMDPHARGAFIGLSSYHGRAHMARAIMEGVAFAMRQAVEITQFVGSGAAVLVGSGGAVENPLWRSILTDVLGQPLHKSVMREQSGVGAAVLAGVGVGIYPGFDAVGERFGHYEAPTLPHAERSALYDARYIQYRSLYPALKAVTG
jgi:xylulokinase